MAKRIKSTDLHRNTRDILDDVRAGETVIVELYGKPIATITPYQETTMYTVEIQTWTGHGWQAIEPAETITSEEAAELNVSSAQELADHTATNQNVATGSNWRVAVWTGTDIGVEPAAVYEPESPAITPDHIRELAAAKFGDMAVLCIDTDNQIEVFPASTAQERGAEVVYDAGRLVDWLDGTDLTDDDAKQLADELTREVDIAHSQT